FDVSHLGQAILAGDGAAHLLETLAPADIEELAPETTRYTQFLDDDGNILDDLMVTRLPGREERLFLVVNAATKAWDFALLKAGFPKLGLDVLQDRAFLALQGPHAAAVLAAVLPGVADMPFMGWRMCDHEGCSLFVSRSGYTGEDGFEISLPAPIAPSFAERLLAHPDVAPIGLGARDTLRLEAGLCLYGHDIDRTTNPIEAGLLWSIGKRRRQQGGFPGFERIRAAIDGGPSRLRVGLLPEAKTPVREGATLFSQNGTIVGRVTSGGFSPSLARPIAMGYVERGFLEPGSLLATEVRGKPIEMRVTRLPFVPHRFFRG
ncbi:MAG: glycine cleavage system aminomethyltransferase GcvT, partial [Methylocystis sp.]|nr:glycine cleavage system aminomethyltransferase GcvT [Methylocystis sp.]